MRLIFTWFLKLVEVVGRTWGFLEQWLHLKTVAGSFRSGYWRSQLGSFGKDGFIHSSVVIHQPKKVSLGRHVTLIEFVHIWGGGGVVIGDDVIIAAHAVITSQTHDKYADLFYKSSMTNSVSIAANCWIGSGAIVLPGVQIGEGSIIGAQTVVTKDVPPYSVVIGVPGRIVETLKPIESTHSNAHNC